MKQLYRLARKILPARIQAKLGNRHKVKRYTLDRLLFRITSHPAEERLCYSKALTSPTVPPESLEGNAFIPPAVAATYRRWYDHQVVQQLVRVRGGVWIEPTTGWPMGAGNQLYLSLHPSGISPYMPLPAYSAIWRKQPVVRLDKIISLRDVNEGGYSHFYTDILGKLALAKQQGVALSEYTPVISKRLAETAYGKHLIAYAPLFGLTKPPFLQGDEFVHAGEALFAAIANPTSGKVFGEVVAAAKASYPLTEAQGNRRIFLTRARSRRRALRNGEEIAAILAGYGFECVDADTLSLPEQIALFTHARHVVGIHGAGLMNVLYRAPAPMSLFEIREPIRPVMGLNAVYHNVAVALGFDYGCTVGRDTHAADMSFTMPPDVFARDFAAFWAKVGE